MSGLNGRKLVGFASSLTGLALFVAVVADAVVDVPRAPISVELPPEKAVLIESDAPGYALAQQKCQICHSVDYIAYQPPSLGVDAWTGEVRKMRDKYGAPVTEEDAIVIGAYLASAYGSASTEEASAALAQVDQAATGDAHQASAADLLTDKTCSACHAVDTALVGPALLDVAAKYRDDPDGEAEIMRSILNGGVGRWGQIPMPPMASVSEDEASVLARYILSL